jgi:ketosteroid isomerase-like protein
MVSAMLAGCSGETKDVIPGRQESIEGIETAEKDFQNMTKEKGIAEAFWFYADSSAVIKRENDTIIRGKEAIREYYSKPFYAKASVSWAPDFIDVSGNSDLGYTYGKYVWQAEDSTGKVIKKTGVFHTVWKKQSNGTWRYVWD